jgi:hypothetical protein
MSCNLCATKATRYYIACTGCVIRRGIHMDKYIAGKAAIPPPSVPADPPAPIDMVMHCPACGEQHIDAPDWHPVASTTEFAPLKWDNPPHRSHLCHGCGLVWRPADVPTNGVRAIKTRGKRDSVV